MGVWGKTTLSYEPVTKDNSITASFADSMTVKGSG